MKRAFEVCGALAWALVVPALFAATPAAASLPEPCLNEAFRTGPSAGLPDCRAYELVSPSTTDGRLLMPISAFQSEWAADLFPTELASPSHHSAIFETLSGAVPGLPEPNGAFDVYEAQRSSSGWQTSRRLSPSGTQAVSPVAGGISSDHGYAFTNVRLIEDGILPNGSLAGETGGDYLRRPDGSFEPTGLGKLATDPLAQGRYISPGGRHVIFSTGNAYGLSNYPKTRLGGMSRSSRRHQGSAQASWTSPS